MTLSICIIIFSLSLFAEITVQSSYLNFNHYNTLETNINYNTNFTKGFVLDYQADFANVSNSFFERSNKNTKINWILHNNNKYLPVSIDYGYHYSLNQGLPEDTVSVVDRQVQLVKLSANKKFMDIFSIKQSFATTKIDAQLNEYRGNRTETTFETNYNLANWGLYNTMNYQNNTVFLDKYENYNNNFFATYNNGMTRIDTDLNLSHQVQDIYTYNAKSDQSKRIDYNDNIRLQIPLMYGLNWSFLHYGSYKRNNFDYNKNRENRTLEQFIDSSIQNDNQYFSIVFGVQNGYAKRYINVNKQDRKTLDKSIYSNIKINQSIIDSINVVLSVLLTQNFHSEAFKMLDNDRQIQIGSLYLQEQLNSIVMLKSTFSIQRNHEVYIDKSLSSNNNRKTTYILQPEIVSSITEKIQLFNSYNLKANYENYIWNEHINDRYYRRLSAEYGFKAIRLNSNPESSVQISSIYETNETAERQSSQWYKNSQNIIRTYAVKLKMYKDNFDYQVEPQLKYHFKKHEIDIMFNMNWHYATNSFIRVNINPIGTTFNKFIWKAFIDINFTY
ncbi:MAG: hypothetical protein RBS16_04800 [Candidatus Cloacimonadales bacterium]|nr:hypothetical protein [Candidatus Cloacimonadota bacterium]MDD2650241.1 hypothetical protein [Candidatus Cloacimonadota bacterium]MDX9977336.1 hypothetical protein [Candidatus Cloacimonadales bacterium]